MGDNLNYDRGMGPEKNWIIEETRFDPEHTGKCEAIFAQGNGYLGLRNSLEEDYVKTKRDLFAAGTFNKASADEVTELPNIPDIVNMELKLDGERFYMTGENTDQYSRILNMYTGETDRSLIWKGEGTGCVRICFHRFVSFANVHIVGSYAEITPLDQDVTVDVKSGIDGQVTNSGAQHFVEVTKRAFDETYLQFIAETTQSKVTVAVHTAHRCLMDGVLCVPEESRIADDRRRVYGCFKQRILKGQTFRIEKLSAIHTSRDLEYAGKDQISGEKVASDGIDLEKQILSLGYDALFRESAKNWADFWKAQDIQIQSTSTFDQTAIRFALYHLRIMTRAQDSRIGIGAKGLSGEGYKGHSFWDTETFIFPYFQMTQPEIARTLLEYRYQGLYGARQKAKEHGYEGAMYPWESAWISDGEVTPYIVGVNVHTGEPMYCLTGLIELHITSDIIYALWNYYVTTKDQDFMDRCGYEMILETARFWNSRLEWIPEHDRYEIRDVIGPDEYKEHVDNNAYTNYMAAYNMDLAVKCIDELKTEKPEIYKRLSGLTDLEALKSQILEKRKLLYLPKPDEKTGIIPQFDGYFDLRQIDLAKYKAAPVVGTLFLDYSTEEIQHCQAGKQADVVELIYQMEDIVSEELKEKNYYYYEARTLHDSSLSRAIHSVIASDIGLKADAYDMFVKAGATDLGQEMSSSDAGIHSANMGGIWQDVVMGFGGVRIGGDHLRIRPSLPEAWQKLCFPLCWRGSRMKVTIYPNRMEIFNEGPPVEVEIGRKMAVVASGENTFVKVG